MDDIKFKATIFADCNSKCTNNDLDLLKRNFDQYKFDTLVQTYNSYMCFISNEPTFRLLSNEYRIPNNTYWNDVYSKQSPIPLNRFLTIEEIKMINYFDYGKEHIHCVMQQEKSVEGIIVSSSKDLNFISNKLISYLDKNKILGFKDIILNELKSIELLSEIALRYNWDIYFYYDCM